MKRALYMRSMPLLVASLMTALSTSGCRQAAEKSTAATNPEHCVAQGKIIDLAVAGDQARSALSPGSGPELKVDSLIARDEGFIVKLLAAAPTTTIGGGGLVWVNAHTGCAIVLARYE